MAQYSKVSSPDGSIHYLDAGNQVPAESVPEAVQTVLQDAADGTVVDELGDPINPATDSDESEDEQLPVNNAPEEDQSTTEDQSEPDVTPEEPTPEPVQEPAPTPVPQEDKGEGFGFPRKDGKTLSIFSDAPHETVKFIGGLTVPLTNAEYESKTNAEIIEKLRELGKVK